MPQQPKFPSERDEYGNRRGLGAQTEQFHRSHRQYYDEKKDMKVIDARRKAAQAAVRGQSQTERPYIALSALSLERQERLQQLQQEIDQKNETITRLGIQEQKLLEIIQRERAEHHGLKVEYTEQINKLGEEIRGDREEISRLEEELEANLQLKGNNSALQQKIDILTQERNNLKKELSEVGMREKEGINKTVRLNKTLQEKLDGLEQAHNSDINRLRSEISAKDREIAVLNSQNETNRNDIGNRIRDLGTQLSAKENEIERLNAQNRTIEEQSAAVEQLLIDKDNHMKMLVETNDTYEKTLAQKDMEITNLKNDNTYARDLSVRVSKQFSILQSKINSLTEEKKASEEEVRRLQAEKDEEVRRLQSEMTKYSGDNSATITNLQQQLQQKTQQEATLSKKIKDLESMPKSNNQESTILRYEYKQNELESQKTELEATIAALKKQLEQKTQQEETLSKKINDLEERAKSNNQESTILRYEYKQNELESQKTELESQKTELEAKLERQKQIADYQGLFINDNDFTEKVCSEQDFYTECCGEKIINGKSKFVNIKDKDKCNETRDRSIEEMKYIEKYAKIWQEWPEGKQFVHKLFENPLNLIENIDNDMKDKWSEWQQQNQDKARKAFYAYRPNYVQEQQAQEQARQQAEKKAQQEAQQKAQQEAQQKLEAEKDKRHKKYLNQQTINQKMNGGKKRTKRYRAKNKKTKKSKPKPKTKRNKNLRKKKRTRKH